MQYNKKPWWENPQDNLDNANIKHIYNELPNPQLMAATATAKGKPLFGGAERDSKGRKISPEEVLRRGYKFIKKNDGSLALVDNNLNVLMPDIAHQPNLNAWVDANNLWMDNKEGDLNKARKIIAIANPKGLQTIEKAITEGGNIAGGIAVAGAAPLFAPEIAAGTNFLLTNPVTQFVNKQGLSMSTPTGVAVNSAFAYDATKNAIKNPSIKNIGVAGLSWWPFVGKGVSFLGKTLASAPVATPFVGKVSNLVPKSLKGSIDKLRKGEKLAEEEFNAIINNRKLANNAELMSYLEQAHPELYSKAVFKPAQNITEASIEAISETPKVTEVISNLADDVLKEDYLYRLGDIEHIIPKGSKLIKEGNIQYVVDSYGNKFAVVDGKVSEAFPPIISPTLAHNFKTPNINSVEISGTKATVMPNVKPSKFNFPRNLYTAPANGSKGQFWAQNPKAVTGDIIAKYGRVSISDIEKAFTPNILIGAGRAVDLGRIARTGFIGGGLGVGGSYLWNKFNEDYDPRAFKEDFRDSNGVPMMLYNYNGKQVATPNVFYSVDENGDYQVSPNGNVRIYYPYDKDKNYVDQYNPIILTLQGNRWVDANQLNGQSSGTITPRVINQVNVKDTLSNETNGLPTVGTPPTNTQETTPPTQPTYNVPVQETQGDIYDNGNVLINIPQQFRNPHYGYFG